VSSAQVTGFAASPPQAANVPKASIDCGTARFAMVAVVKKLNSTASRSGSSCAASGSNGWFASGSTVVKNCPLSSIAWEALVETMAKPN
jgi:hypothetical protein